MVISLLLTLRYSVGDRVQKPKAHTAGSNSQGKNAPSHLFMTASVPRNPRGSDSISIYQHPSHPSLNREQPEVHTLGGILHFCRLSPLEANIPQTWLEKPSLPAQKQCPVLPGAHPELPPPHARCLPRPGIPPGIAGIPPWSTGSGSACPWYKHLEPPGCWELKANPSAT